MSRCLYCDSVRKTSVVNSRSSTKSVSTWRRRQCKDCQAIITTRESVDLEAALRVQSSDGLQAFIRDRLFLDIHRSVSHRKTALTDARELTDTIITAILRLHTNGVLERGLLVSTAHDIIRRFDTAAGVSYAAHHK